MAKNNSETLHLSHADFELYVSADSLDKPRSRLEATYRQRGLSLVNREASVVLGGSESNGLDGQPFFF